ncbi:voltage-dependent calcium channel subunit alpha-2/delta-2-like [Dendronephthya gigantea]|uniref:voltage-dependent calcium channel subunit alpha-2/delta-2-like n=1 Tax=Dendronephthya gigantea TaxID=151771 RepID=UPI00106CC563|nr:voltage-dependent calcium channel subunit alpha-2/delta-2-like [Dendronephthya gigantea]
MFQRTFYMLSLGLLISLADAEQPGLNLFQVQNLADDISKKITNMWQDTSGFSHLKKAYEESLTEVVQGDVKQLLTESAYKMEQYFSKKVDSLQRIKTKAGIAYAERKTDAIFTAKDVKYVNMIDLNKSSIPVTLHFDQRFKKEVNISYSGIQIPTNVYDQGPVVLKTINWTSELDEVFIDNLKNRDDTLKWQYFGSPDAVFRTYPAKRWTNPYYSARKRPWYTQGATSPKNMVILIDSSGSMVGKNSVIGRLAVSNLIDTLSNNDFFNVLYFNTAVKFLSCNKTLLQATRNNREWFKSRLRTSGYKNVAEWKTALNEAFEILKTSEGAKCQKMIMIFSDGTEHKYEDVFERHNKHKEIRVFTYLLGSPSPAYSSNDLMWMACSNKGYFYKVPTVGSVRDLIEDYVSVLSRPMATNMTLNPVWTGIYRDASGLGMMVTATLPVFHERTFLGVCGTDVTISQLVNFVYQPYIGPGGYPFIINNNGHIIKHPNLRAMYGYVKSANDIDLSEAEFVPEEEKDHLLALRKKMLSIKDGETGEETINAFSFTEYERYLRITPIKRTYIFTKIRKTPFSLGIASSQIGYEVLQYKSYAVENETDGIVLLKDWKHCNSTVPPLKTTAKNLRRLLQGSDCSVNLMLDLNITENVWSNSNISSFVKTNWGLVRVSQSNGSNVLEEKMFQRISNLNENSIIVSIPYNDGKSDATSANLLVYKGIQINVSNLSIIPIVTGFQTNEEVFLKDHLMNITSKDKYHVYLLDENAFIVSSSLNSSKNVCGQFFGSLDWELMSELEKGSEPFYTRYTLRNEQGECVQSPTKSSSSSFNYPFYSVLTSSFTSWAKNVLACLLHFNIYNLFFATTAGATTDAQSQTNRSCVTNITAYYGNTTRWKPFSGNTTCLDCGNNEDLRQYFVVPVRGTNLVLVLVENFAEKAIFRYMKRTDHIPGTQKEIEIQDATCSSYFTLPREHPERCVLSHSEETQYSCGKAKMLEPATIFIIFYTLYHIIQLRC